MALVRHRAWAILLGGALVVAGLASAGGLRLARREYAAQQRARHAAAGETQLRVVNATGAVLALRRAGATLDDVARERLGEETWLREGRYFLEASIGPTRLYHPVTVDPLAEAPDEDGGWTITVRPPSPETPPVLEAGGLGFAYIPGGPYHASGNAREWTRSAFRRVNATHPWRDDERDDEEAEGFRVTRGGSWYSASAVRLQLAYREEFQPELASDDLGFRIAAFLGAGRPPER